MQGIFLRLTGMILAVFLMCGCGAQSELVFVPQDGAGEAVSSKETAISPGAAQDTERADFSEREDVSSEIHRSSVEKQGTESVPTEKPQTDERQSDGTEIGRTDAAGTKQADDSESVEGIGCYVHVCGAVKAPGVYRLQKGARVFEAIELAGGIAEDGYGDGINQALPVSDGDRVWVPTVDEWEKGITDRVAPPSGDFANASGDGTDGTDSHQQNGDISGQFADADKVNINTADAARLCTLPGIGQTKAEAVVEYRRTHGEFSDISQIQNVTGIKEGLYRKIKDKIKV